MHTYVWVNALQLDSTATESYYMQTFPLDDEDTAVSTTERNKKILLTPWALPNGGGNRADKTLIKAVSEEVRGGCWALREGRVAGEKPEG